MTRWVAIVYLAAVLLQSIIAIAPARRWLWLPKMMGLIFVVHILYGLGFWRGCLKKPQPPPPAVSASVKIEKIQ